jgi:hypothetical protein
VTAPDPSFPCEVVGLFGDRGHFEMAVTKLRDAGFGHADLSVLSSHESIDAAGRPAKPWREVLTAIVGDIRFEAPLIASGAIFLAGGPMAATVAALIGAAVTGVAVKDVLDKVTAEPHTADFARALDAGGVILWARANDSAQEAVAREILRGSHAGNVHSVSVQAAEQATTEDV